MKARALIFSLFFFVITLQAQEKSNILPLMEKIIQKSIDKDYDGVMDLTYPKVFEIANRQQMIALITSVLENEDFQIKILPTAPEIKISEVKNLLGGRYSLIHYNNAMTLKFKNLQNLNPNEFLPLLKESFPHSVVNYNKETQSFDILIRSRNLAISDEYTHGKWRFLNANPQDGQILRLLLDEQILNAFGL